jgi:ABC-type multidrug transport system fused ATPase/permease subunit
MFGYLGPFKRIMAVGAVFSIIATLVAVFDPLVLAMGIDVVFGAGGTFDTLLLLVVLYVVLKVTSWTLRGINTWMLALCRAFNQMSMTISSTRTCHIISQSRVGM